QVVGGDLVLIWRDDYLYFLMTTSVLLKQLMKPADLLSCLSRGQIHPEPAITIPGYPFERGQTLAAKDDRYAAGLRRLWIGASAFEPDELSIEARFWLSPELSHRLDIFK